MNGDRDNYGSYDGFEGEYSDDYREAVLEQIRLAKIRRKEADKRARDKLRAEVMIVAAAVIVIVLICSIIIHVGKRRQETAKFVSAAGSESSSAKDLKDISEPIEKNTKTPIVGSSPFAGEAVGHKLVQIDGVTYIDGIMIVNKTFSLPATFSPGLDKTAEDAFNEMASAAWGEGISLFICSGFRTYREQEMLYNNYAAQRGVEEADRVSSRAGHSEHQSGLCMDVNTTDFDFAGTKEAVWLANNCADYGFIIRFPIGKENITGYAYEPWHIRYVGKEAAKEITDQDICLEEYLNVSSDYKNSSDQVL